MEQFPGDQRLRVWLWVLMKWLEFKAVRRVVCIDTEVTLKWHRVAENTGEGVSRSQVSKCQGP